MNGAETVNLTALVLLPQAGRLKLLDLAVGNAVEPVGNVEPGRSVRDGNDGVVGTQVEDVLDDHSQGSQRSQGDRDVRDDRIRDSVGDQQPTSRTADADAEIANGVVEIHYIKQGLCSQA